MKLCLLIVSWSLCDQLCLDALVLDSMNTVIHPECLDPTFLEQDLVLDGIRVKTETARIFA